MEIGLKLIAEIVGALLLFFFLIAAANALWKSARPEITIPSLVFPKNLFSKRRKGSMQWDLAIAVIMLGVGLLAILALWGAVTGKSLPIISFITTLFRFG